MMAGEFNVSDHFLVPAHLAWPRKRAKNSCCCC